jgi:hypothetical protein
MKAKVILVAMLAAFALALGGSMLDRRRDGDLKTAHDSLAVALRDGARQRSLVDFLTSRAAGAEQRADSEASRADSLARVLVPKRARAAQLAATAPDTCRPALDAAQVVIDGQQDELAARAQSLVDARSALADTRAALDTLVPSYERLRAAATRLDDVSRPSLRQRLTPRFGVGGAAGIDIVSHRPAAVAGVTLGWTF